MEATDVSREAARCKCQVHMFHQLNRGVKIHPARIKLATFSVLG